MGRSKSGHCCELPNRPVPTYPRLKKVVVVPVARKAKHNPSLHCEPS